MTAKKGLGETVLGWFVVREEDENQPEATTEQLIEKYEKKSPPAAPAPARGRGSRAPTRRCGGRRRALFLVLFDQLFRRRLRLILVLFTYDEPPEHGLSETFLRSHEGIFASSGPSVRFKFSLCSADREQEAPAGRRRAPVRPLRVPEP